MTDINLQELTDEQLTELLAKLPADRIKTIKKGLKTQRTKMAEDQRILALIQSVKDVATDMKIVTARVVTLVRHGLGLKRAGSKTGNSGLQLRRYLLDQAKAKKLNVTNTAKIVDLLRELDWTEKQAQARFKSYTAQSAGKKTA